jgi:hypothetical protein
VNAAPGAAPARRHADFSFKVPTSSNPTEKDVADYPYDTVPNKVNQLFCRAQLFHGSYIYSYIK